MEKEIFVTLKGIQYIVLVEYKVVDNSFDHAFGTEHRIGIDVKSYKCYKMGRDETVDVLRNSDLDKRIRQKANEEIEDVVNYIERDHDLF